jgi:hypothetical protein
MWWFFFFQILAPEKLQNHFSFSRNSARKDNKKGRFAARFRDVCAQVTIPTNAQQQSFPSLEERADVWSHCCRSRACHCTSRACEEPSQVAAVVGEEEQAFSEFLPVVGFLQCLTGLVASSPGWSGTRIWLPLYCNTSTTRGLVCLTKK